MYRQEVRYLYYTSICTYKILYYMAEDYRTRGPSSKKRRRQQCAGNDVAVKWTGKIGAIKQVAYRRPVFCSSARRLYREKKYRHNSIPVICLTMKSDGIRRKNVAVDLPCNCLRARLLYYFSPRRHITFYPRRNTTYTRIRRVTARVIFPSQVSPWKTFIAPPPPPPPAVDVVFRFNRTATIILLSIVININVCTLYRIT